LDRRTLFIKKVNRVKLVRDGRKKKKGTMGGGGNLAGCATSTIVRGSSEAPKTKKGKKDAGIYQKGKPVFHHQSKKRTASIVKGKNPRGNCGSRNTTDEKRALQRW